jgi:peptidoglycan/LPS O-acetylase OafA/YrhL
MITLFAFGALAAERRSLTNGLSTELRRTCGRATAVGVAITAALGAAITLTDDPDPFLGGLWPQATLIPLAEATIAVGMSLWAVDWFRRHSNRAGTLMRGMGWASFSAYLVHAPITVILAIAMRKRTLPPSSSSSPSSR